MTKYSVLPKFALSFVVLASIAGCASCRDGKDDNGHAMARQLFMKSVSLIRTYTDSIGNVSDSASFQRMTRGFEDNIVKVNFQFPPDTDLRMTQEENDSLINMLDSLVSVIHKKEKELGKALAADSIRTDSVKPYIAIPETRASSSRSGIVLKDSVDN